MYEYPCDVTVDLAIFDLQERKIDLKENLLIELDDKKKSIENERLTMELTGGETKHEDPRQNLLRKFLFCSELKLIAQSTFFRFNGSENNHNA